MGRADEEALERFVAARDAADGEGAARAWAGAVELVHDRIVGAVDLEGLDVERSEREDIVQAVHLDLWRLWRAGAGVEPVRTSVRRLAHERSAKLVHRAGTADGGGSHPRDSEIEAAWAQHLQPAPEARGRELLDWALPELHPRLRIAWTDAQAGVDPEATMVKLRVTRANLRQLRQEAMLQLLSHSRSEARDVASPGAARALSDFIDGWNAGRRPRIDEHLDRVPELERTALAEQLGLWLELAPPPEWSAAQRDGIRAEPVVARIHSALGSDAGLLPLELPRLRARRSLSVRDVTVALVDGLGLASSDIQRVQDHLKRLEGGSHDAAELSRRVVDALAGALGSTTEALRAAAIFSAGAFRPSTAGGTLHRADPDDGRWVEADLEALTRAAMVPAPEAPDDLDRLFCGGWDA